MSASQVIREIEALAPDEREEVIRFVVRLKAQSRLSGGELSELAGQLANTTDESKAGALRAELERGFYGGERNA